MISTNSPSRSTNALHSSVDSSTEQLSILEMKYTGPVIGLQCTKPGNWGGAVASAEFERVAGGRATREVRCGGYRRQRA